MTQEQRISVIKSMIIDFQNEIIKKYDEMSYVQPGSASFNDFITEINEYKEHVEPLMQFLEIQEKSKN